MNVNLKDEVDLLTKALNREKMARAALEVLLEKQNKKKFEINKKLLESYENARIREIQLQFIAFLSKSNISGKSIDEILKYFVHNISLLLENASACIIKRKKNEIVEAWHKKENENEWRAISYSDIEIDFEYKDTQWSMVECKNKYINTLLVSHYQLCVGFNYKENDDVIIIIGGDHFCYGDDFKQTLDIAAKQCSAILQQRLTDVESSYNYQKLQKTMTVLKATQNQLVHSERMASLGTLAAGVAHEINNPLSYLTSNLEVLSEYIETLSIQINYQNKGCETNLNNVERLNQQKAQEVLDDLPSLQAACIDATKRIEEIVSSLRSFSRKDDKEKKSIEISGPIKAALEIVKSQSQHKYEIEEIYQHKSSLLLGDFGQLQQVFINFIINALHSMPDGGKVTIGTALKSNTLQVSIKDQGHGIPKEHISRIFEPFFTTKKVNKGTGLGLSVSYSIIKSHGANIEINSKEGEGTEFLITFPLV